jgi:hypothetical protein
MDYGRERICILDAWKIEGSSLHYVPEYLYFYAPFQKRRNHMEGLGNKKPSKVKVSPGSKCNANRGWHTVLDRMRGYSDFIGLVYISALIPFRGVYF